MFTKRLEIESILLILLGGVMGILAVTVFNPSFKYKFFPVETKQGLFPQTVAYKRLYIFQAPHQIHTSLILRTLRRK